MEARAADRQPDPYCALVEIQVRVLDTVRELERLGEVYPGLLVDDLVHRAERLAGDVRRAANDSRTVAR